MRLGVEPGAGGENGAPSPAPHSFCLCQHQSHLPEGCRCCTRAAPCVWSTMEQEPRTLAALVLPQEITVRWVSGESQKKKIADEQVSVVHPRWHQHNLLALDPEGCHCSSITADTGQTDVVHGQSPQPHQPNYEK